MSAVRFGQIFYRRKRRERRLDREGIGGLTQRCEGAKKTVEGKNVVASRRCGRGFSFGSEWKIKRRPSVKTDALENTERVV